MVGARYVLIHIHIVLRPLCFHICYYSHIEIRRPNPGLPRIPQLHIQNLCLGVDVVLSGWKMLTGPIPDLGSMK